MSEHIVDLDGNVHELITRCQNCELATIYGPDSTVPGFCRYTNKALWRFDGFCSHAKPKRHAT